MVKLALPRGQADVGGHEEAQPQVADVAAGGGHHRLGGLADHGHDPAGDLLVRGQDLEALVLQVGLGQAVQVVVQFEGVVAVGEQDHPHGSVFLQPQHQVHELVAQVAHVRSARSDHANGGAAVGDLAIEILVFHGSSWQGDFGG